MLQIFDKYVPMQLIRPSIKSYADVDELCCLEIHESHEAEAERRIKYMVTKWISDYATYIH